MLVRSLVGYTSSQKQFYQYEAGAIKQMSQDVTDFTNDDYFDAIAVFEYVLLVYWRRFGEFSKDYNCGRGMMAFLNDRISKEYWEQRRVELRLVTAFDLSNYGRKHCLPYLQELIGR
jgi:hypothetical protein